MLRPHRVPVRIRLLSYQTQYCIYSKHRSVYKLVNEVLQFCTGKSKRLKKQSSDFHSFRSIMRRQDRSNCLQNFLSLTRPTSLMQWKVHTFYRMSSLMLPLLLVSSTICFQLIQNLIVSDSASPSSSSSRRGSGRQTQMHARVLRNTTSHEKTLIETLDTIHPKFLHSVKVDVPIRGATPTKLNRARRTLLLL